MSSQEDNDTFVDTVASPSVSVSQTTLPLNRTATDRYSKKRKVEEENVQTISENNQARFKVLKKLNIQLTRTNHHISYLKKCKQNRTIPKSLRVTLTPQVPVVSSYLQLKWEQAQIDFGLTLTSILLEYWDNRWKSITDEIKVISDLIKETTEESEIEFMTTIISRITTNVERDLSTKKTPNQSQPTKN